VDQAGLDGARLEWTSPVRNVPRSRLIGIYGSSGFETYVLVSGRPSVFYGICDHLKTSATYGIKRAPAGEKSSL
jgi:hypothetical protein